jgi:hypothetical protein
MAYWRNYRKWASQVNNLVASDSSDNENIAAGRESDAFHCSNVIPQHNELSETAFVSISGESSDKSLSDNDNSTCSSASESDGNCDENSELQPTTSETTFRQQLKLWASANKCQHRSLNELLDILRQQGHELPKDARTLLETPRDVPVLTKCGGQYIYFGIEQGIIKNLSKYQKNAQHLNSIELVINIDGLPLFKSSSQQFWPILCQFNKLDVFVIALFYGTSKPTSVDEYLHDFLQEFDIIKSNGILYNERKYEVKLRCFCCDAPARSFLKCIVGHTGYFACERCVIKGVWNGRVVFDLDLDVAPRTDEEFANFMYTNHQKSLSPLTDHGVSCVQQFCLDYMHLVCLGVVKRILCFLRKGPRRCKLSSQQINHISSQLSSLKGAMPSEFSRQPRSLVEVERWKATEFRQFLLYTGPVVLKNVVSKELYEHFLTLSVAVSILLDTDDESRNCYLDYATQLLNYFVEHCKHVYGDTFTVYNVHSLLHLPEDVRRFNCSLNDISCFPFENYMQCLKRHVRNGNNPIAQVAKRVAELSHTTSKSTSKCNFNKIGTVVSNFKDSCFLLKDKFAFVREKRDDGRLVCDVFSERQLESFYTRPANSKLFKIVYVKDIHQRAKRRLIEESQILRKAVCLPMSTGYVIFPLRHEVERST